MPTAPAPQKPRADDLFPVVDVRAQSEITAEQADFFRANGLLLIRGLIQGEELEALQRETAPLVQRSLDGTDHPDHYFKEHEVSGERTPFRVEYVADKTESVKRLLAHPFILRSVERLQGRNFIPTWDSMVFKTAGKGVAIPWHRDAGTDCTDPQRPIFNVDIYLDHADLRSCVWGILGTNRWDQAQAMERCNELNRDLTGDWAAAGAVPIPMEPGDVLFHDILVLHGSQPTTAPLRRVIYLEFRPGEVELAQGPHIPAYIPKKQQVLAAAIRRRSACHFAHQETPYVMRPDPAFVEFSQREPGTWRFDHGAWWR
jgi:phytanoyl-CoA hydroxylase